MCVLMAYMHQIQTTGNTPFADLPPIYAQLAEAKARKGKMFSANQCIRLTSHLERIGLTYEQIAKAIGKDEVWVAAAFYGQVSDHLL